MLFRSLILSAALAPTAVSADLLKIPIKKVPNKKHVANLLLSHTPPRLAAASAAVSATGRKLRRSAPADAAEDVLLHDLGNAQYYGEVRIGSPPQEFEVVYDTGSADTWVPGTSCAANSLNCGGKNVFDETASTSFSTPVFTDGENTVDVRFTIEYGSGKVEGTYGVDKVTIGDDDTVEEQTFAFVDTTEGLGTLYNHSDFDGILGLAFPSISRLPAVPTVIGNLASVGKGMFAFYLADEADGELAIGGYNEARMQGEINWVDLARPAYWLVSLDSVKFGDTVIAASTTGGIMDTGTSLLYGPKGQVDAMLASIGGATFNTKIGLYRIPCEANVPDLILAIGGKEYTIPSRDLVLQDDTSMRCFFGVAVMELGDEDNTLDGDLEEEVVHGMPSFGEGAIPSEFTENTWLIGDSFLRQYYTIYDYAQERFGLADLKDQE